MSSATRAPSTSYLIGKGVEPERAAEAAETVHVPLDITKRGAVVFARRR